MTFNATITITNLTPKTLADLLARIGAKPYGIHVTRTDERSAPAAKKTFKKMNGDTVLALTGKKAQRNSNREKMLALFEKMEVKSGVGSVTRVQFRQEVDKKGLSPTVIGQLIKDGYLEAAS